jgi:hypothetical protein
MPWSKKNPPGPSKNWPTAAQNLCIRVANGALRGGASDGDAIRACISAVKRKYPKAIGSGKKSASDFTASFYSIPSIELKEEEGRFTSRIPVLPAGKFKHPWYGDLDFTEPVLRAAKRHFDGKTLGIDVMVDEGHDRAQALGWFKSVAVGEIEMGGQKHNGLHALVEWTVKGQQMLKDKIYQYFSAEFGTYLTPDGKKVPNILFGGGLTNRPYFKQMPAVKFDDGGQAIERFQIGIFADQLWAFEEDTEENEEEADHSFFASFSLEGTEDDTEEEDDDTDEDDDEDDEVKFSAELITHLNKAFGLKLKEGEDEAIEAALAKAFASTTALETLQSKLVEAGVKLDTKSKTEDAIVAAFTALKTTNDEHGTAIEAIRTELSENKAAGAVDLLVAQRKLAPAKRDHYVKIYKMDPELFADMTKDLEPVFSGEEIGGDGVPVEPGSGAKKEFKDPEAATAEADEYLHLVPALVERGLPATNGKKKD